MMQFYASHLVYVLTRGQRSVENRLKEGAGRNWGDMGNERLESSQSVIKSRRTK